MTRRSPGVFAASVAVALAAGLFAPRSHAADGIEPIAPIAPITASISPIVPIEASGEPAPGPRAPRVPRTPNAPSLEGPEGVQDRVAETESGIAQLTARLASIGLSDGQPFSALGSQEAIDLLRDSREAFASPLQPPQVSVDAAGCPTSAPDGSLRDGAAQIGAAELCARSVAQAATPEAAAAIKWAFRQLGAPYACGGVGRMDEYRFDCSSLVTRAYAQGAGLATASDTWAPTTRDLMPWDGASLVSWAEYVAPEDVRPGDLLLYRSCTSNACDYQHVVMALADGYMLHTNRCGDVAHVAKSWGTGAEKNFEVARRVNPEKAR